MDLYTYMNIYICALLYARMNTYTYVYVSTFVCICININVNIRKLQGSASGFVQILVSFNEHHFVIIVFTILNGHVSQNF